eukprot:CAMPEP_0117462884 /NCGR_PEP_ID=MMETSP0784-20121206/3285_1 /TAXON_ID=39447 /ORGANISM="" /LENGTH=99 /DNA_ID=CAMNT_0005256665 /DNA_START=43 /DNA_END=342 /DNA_ORIENTATION=-
MGSILGTASLATVEPFLDERFNGAGVFFRCWQRARALGEQTDHMEASAIGSLSEPVTTNKLGHGVLVRCAHRTCTSSDTMRAIGPSCNNARLPRSEPST